jgi:hypothetical protein
VLPRRPVRELQKPGVQQTLPVLFSGVGDYGIRRFIGIQVSVRRLYGIILLFAKRTLYKYLVALLDILDLLRDYQQIQHFFEALFPKIGG